MSGWRMMFKKIKSGLRTKPQGGMPPRGAMPSREPAPILRDRFRAGAAEKEAPDGANRTRRPIARSSPRRFKGRRLCLKGFGASPSFPAAGADADRDLRETISGFTVWEKLRALRDRPEFRLRLFICLGTLVILIGLAQTFVSWGLKAPGGGKVVEFDIPKGAPTSWVAEKLYRQGIIRNPVVFRCYARCYHLDKKIKSGTYRLSSDLTVSGVLVLLTKGGQLAKRFTIPEGFTLAEIARRLDEQGIVEKNDFLGEAAAGRFNYRFLNESPAGPACLEGYLFPDTYQVLPDTPAHAVIELMLRRFAEVAGEIDLPAEAGKQGLTLNEAVTLASLVEREAKLGEERALIAGVLYNRLRRGIPLQVDATVEYALGEHRERILYSDLEVDSPYNTYRITGLPPGPIAAPGRASLLAAVEPEKTDYLYYVAKPDGSHAFARTLGEHNANKERYLKN
ncbi:MAG: endolytic transglycosylase MltG [Bacillota bacterium]